MKPEHITTWSQLLESAPAGLYVQNPNEVDETLVGHNDKLPAHITKRPMTRLDYYINEDDYDAIPRMVLVGHGPAVQNAVEQCIDWGGTFTEQWKAKVRAWAAGI